jgi:hypothetical protein
MGLVVLECFRKLPGIEIGPDQGGHALMIIDLCRVVRGAGPVTDLQGVLVQNSQLSQRLNIQEVCLRKKWNAKELTDNDTSMSQGGWGKQAEPKRQRGRPFDML